MRVAILCPIYIQGRSYQENIWAEQLTKLGHKTRVIFAGRYNEPPKEIVEPFGAYETHRVRTWYLPRSTFVSKYAQSAARRFNPDLILLIGDKQFSMGLLKDPALGEVPIISLFSENLSMHEFDLRKKGISLKQRLWALGFRILRARPIRAVCRRSTLIIGNTPQTRGILLPLFAKVERGQIDEKIIDRPLGFSPHDFCYNARVRRSIRSEFGVTDDEILVCVTSRFAPTKAEIIKMLLDALRRAMRDEPIVKALIVGFSEGATSRELATNLTNGPFADRFIRHPYADRMRLSGLYNASDIAVFGRASISCQEALGTGLFGVFTTDGSLNHLVTLPDQGAFFEPGDTADVAEKIAIGVRTVSSHSGDARQAFRRRLADAARWLGYDRIIDSILSELEQRRTGRPPGHML